MGKRNNCQNYSWIIFIHQLPAKPEALRMKVWRDLQKIGAFQLKNSTYVLPDANSCYYQLEELAREIRGNKGECYLFRTNDINGINEEVLKNNFKANADKSFIELNKELTEFLSSLKSMNQTEDTLMQLKHEFGKLLKRYEDSKKIDFFSSEGQKKGKKLILEIENKIELLHKNDSTPKIEQLQKMDYLGRTWVTRKDVHVDRIASAWLIKNFIDPKAKFKFVGAKNYKSKNKECCFDMFNGEFTHIKDLCTFEVLVQSFDLRTSGLDLLAEIIHDLDFKDDKFELNETSTVEVILNGIIREYKDDMVRIEQASHFFKHLLISFQNKF